VAFSIDFSSATPALSAKELFAPAPRGGSIQLPAAQMASNIARLAVAADVQTNARERERANLLPDDMHFSSRQLLRLFMKPKFAVRPSACRCLDGEN
jgi:condensin complex subunit 2